MNKIIPQAALVLAVCVSWGAGKASAEDPGDRGPLDVTRMEYNYGDTAFQAPGFPGPIELTGSVHFPTDFSGGPFPLIVFMHGRHATCYQGSTIFIECGRAAVVTCRFRVTRATITWRRFSPATGTS